MDHSRGRPGLPGSTPIPGNKQIYGQLLSPTLSQPSNNMEELGLGDIPPPKIKNKSAERAVQKMISKLPYEIRESVSTFISMTKSSSEFALRDLEKSNREVYFLRTELSRRSTELLTLKKTLESYQDRSQALEDSIGSLKDEVNVRHSFAAKSRSAMSKLAATNRMLIDSLDALDGGNANGNTLHNQLNDINNGGSNLRNLNFALTPSRSTSRNPSRAPSPTGGRPKPEETAPILPVHTIGSKPPSPKCTPTVQDYVQNIGKSKHPNQNQGEEGEQDNSYKLRESLLKVSREHYKSLKNAEVLDAKVTELRALLKAAESLNRKLKSELDEICSTKMREDVQDHASSARKNMEAAVVVASGPIKEKKFGHIDERFNALLVRNAIDPVDGILELRRILAHIATAPNTLNLTETLYHIVQGVTMKILDCDMVCIYLLKPGSDRVLHRYTVRSKEPDVFDMEAGSSVAAEIIQNGKVLRLNSIVNSSFNVEVDSPPGVVAKRMLSMPLFNTDTNTIVGAVHLINKCQTNDVFSEADELFGLIYADQCSLLISSCMLYESVSRRSALLECTLESSTSLYEVVPHPDSLATSKLLAPAEVLQAMEVTAMDTLKCTSARAFLVSDCITGFDGGRLVFIDYNESKHNTGKKGKRTAQGTLTAPVHSGVAGMTVKTHHLYTVEEGQAGFDASLNPIVDLESDNAMITVPIMTLFGTVIGAIQMVVGPNSPPMTTATAGDPHNRKRTIGFPQAAQWLAHQYASPLQYLLTFIGKPPLRPPSTPNRIGSSTVSSPLGRLATPGSPNRLKGSLLDASFSQVDFYNNRKMVGPFEDATGSGSHSTIVSLAGKGDKGDFVSLPLSITVEEDGLSKADFEKTAEEKKNAVKEAEELKLKLEIENTKLQQEQVANSELSKKLSELQNSTAADKAASASAIAKVAEYEQKMKKMQSEIDTLKGADAVHVKMYEQKLKDKVGELEKLKSHEHDHDDDVNKIAKLTKECEASSAKVTELETELQGATNATIAANADKVDLEAKLAAAEAKMATLIKENKNAKEAGLEVYEEEINELQDKVETLEGEKADLEDKLKESPAVSSEDGTPAVSAAQTQRLGDLEIENKIQLDKIESLQKQIADKQAQSVAAAATIVEDHQEVVDITVEEAREKLKAAMDENNRILLENLNLRETAASSESEKKKLLASQGTFMAQIADLDGQVEEKEEKVESLEAEMKALKKELNTKDKTMTILQEQVVKMANEKMNSDMIEMSHISSGDGEGGNESTSQVTRSPDGSMQSDMFKESVVQKGEWVQHFDEHGQEYWVSDVTGESLWEIPEGSAILSEGMSVGDSFSAPNLDNTATGASMEADGYSIEL